MPALKYKTRQLILLGILFIAISCQNRKANEPLGNESPTCDSSLETDYKKLTGEATDIRQLSAQIQAYYKHAPTGCHDMVVRLVIEDLFNLVYNNPSLDTIIIPFLTRLSEEQTITRQNRTKALFSIAAYYIYAQQNATKALTYIQLAQKDYPVLNDTLARFYNSLMGQIKLQQSDLQASSVYYLRAIALCEKLKDSVSIAGTYANYGTVFSRMGDYAKSIEMKKKAIGYFEAQKSYNKLIIGYAGIATEYGYMRAYDSAIAYYFKAIKLTEQGIKNPNIEFDIYLSLGGISLGKNDFEKARYYYGKTKEVLDQLRDPQHERMYIMASAPAFAGVRNVDAEIAKIKSYIPLYYADNELASARNAYYCLYHIYYVQNKNDLALKNYQVYDSLKNILADQDNKQYVAELETKYATQKKELKIQVQQKEIKQQNTLNGFLWTLVATTAIAAAFVVTRIQLRRKRKESSLQQKFTRQLMENTEEERVRIARDLHDGVSQELLVLKHQIKNNHEHTNEKIDTIINEIRMISRDLHPVMLDKIGLAPSIQHICDQMMENDLLFVTADITYNNSLDKNGELQLFRMIQEALNNIVKYAGAQAAKVTISETAKYVITEIADNGKGFDVSAALKSKNSFGLLSMMERSKALHGKTEIASSQGGTVIKIEIPRTDV